MRASVDAAYFDRLYARSEDPWGFATSEYEREKYRETLRMLGGNRFRSGLELGCSIGALTAMLAPFCDRLLAVDVSLRALATARRRCRGQRQVRFAQMNVPRELPAGRFDFVLVSEIGYYWSDADLDAAIERIAALAHGVMVELVHFLPPVAEHVRSGDDVHQAFLAHPQFEPVDGVRRERYRVDVMRVR